LGGGGSPNQNFRKIILQKAPWETKIMARSHNKIEKLRKVGGEKQEEKSRRKKAGGKKQEEKSRRKKAGVKRFKR